MIKLLSILTVAAVSALTIPAPASADDDLPACPEGYEAYMSAGGPRCGNPIYLDGTWNDDPRDCVWGYFQGSCAPEPAPPTVLPEEAYEFQMTEEGKAAWTPAPMWQPPAVTVQTAAPVGKVELFRAAMTSLLG